MSGGENKGSSMEEIKLEAGRQTEGRTSAKPPQLSGIQGLISFNPVIELPVSLRMVTVAVAASGRMIYSSIISLKIY